MTATYVPPKRDLRPASTQTPEIEITFPNEEMEKSWNVVKKLDPTLIPEEAVNTTMLILGRLLCRFCGFPLVKDGQNGAGTQAFLCKRCGKKASIRNTFESIIFRFKKLITAIAAYIYLNSSVEKTAAFYGIKPSVLWEAIWILPLENYCIEGEPETLSYEKEKIAVINLDTFYNGDRGAMLGVSGKWEIGVEGNEKTGEGLDEFLQIVREKIAEADRYLFIMDMNLNVARKIIAKFGRKAIIIMQNHSLWGDVLVYLHHNNRWCTLRLRTDAFAETRVKRNEQHLLPPGECQLYEGFKRLNPRFRLRDLKPEVLAELGEELVNKLEKVTRNDLEGRVDLVMQALVRNLNAVLKALGRGPEFERLREKARQVMEKITHTYARKPGRTVKRKIMNAWEKLRVMEEDVKTMGRTLLGEDWVKGFEEREQKRKERNKRLRDQKGGMMMVMVTVRRSGKTRRPVSAEGRNSSIVVLFPSPL